MILCTTREKHIFGLPLWASWPMGKVWSCIVSSDAGCLKEGSVQVSESVVTVTLFWDISGVFNKDLIKHSSITRERMVL
jgi:hypothetical protein